MPVISQPQTSTQYVQQQVTALLNGAAYDPSGLPVAVAFVPVPTYGPPPDPTSAQWNTASWETDANPVTYWASILVGPLNGGVSLTAGSYQMFVKITGSPEVPVIAGWTLAVT